MEQTRRDMLKGLVGLVATVALPDTSYGQESQTRYKQEGKKVPYTDLKEILREKMILRYEGTQRDKETEKIWNESTPREQKIVIDALTKPLTEKEKSELETYVRENPVTPKEKAMIDKKIMWKANYDNPYSAVNRMRKYIDEYISRATTFR